MNKWWNRELTLKCKVLLDHMNNPMGINPSKGSQGTGQKVRRGGRGRGEHFEMWWLENT